jgi:methionyl-tRNA formyltransferase
MMSEKNKILVITDNLFILEEFQRIMNNHNFSADYRCSPNSPLNELLSTLIIKDNISNILTNYNIIFSAHCKQLFPKEIVNTIKCINIHPGLNPYNRGWFPQVFSILNKLPLGATIHEMDDELDHGAIICQKEIELEVWDTSLTAYNKVQNMEVELLEQWLPKILSGNYCSVTPKIEGNINFKKDFNRLCEIDLNKIQKIGDTIDLLRALSHGDYKNAYFIDDKTSEKVFIRLEINKI